MEEEEERTDGARIDYIITSTASNNHEINPNITWMSLGTGYPTMQYSTHAHIPVFNILLIILLSDVSFVVLFLAPR